MRVLAGFALAAGLGGCPKRGGPATPAVQGVQVGHGLPPATVPVLDALAQSTDPVVRGEALSVILLAEAAPAGGERLAAALWDPSPWVRARGAEVLVVRHAEPASRAAFLDLAGRADVSPHTICPMAQHLVATTPPGALPDAATSALRELMVQRLSAERRPWLRLPCALAVATTGSPAVREEMSGGLLDEMGATLEEGGLPLDARFVRHVLRTAPPELDPVLGQLPATVEDVLLLPVVLGLVERGHPVGMRTAQGMISGADDELLVGLALGLGDLDGEAALALLRQLASHDDALVSATASLLSATAGGGAAGALERALESERLELRLLAMRVLGDAICEARRTGGHRGLERLGRATLERTLQAERPRERVASVALLARIGAARDRSRIEPLLAAEDPELRLAAAKALVGLGTGTAP